MVDHYVLSFPRLFSGIGHGWIDVLIRQENVEGVLNGLEATGRLALADTLVLVAAIRTGGS